MTKSIQQTARLMIAVIGFVVAALTATPALAEWVNTISEDEMTGRKLCFAISPTTKATRQMDVPYDDIETRIVVGHDKGGHWAYFWFSKHPNIISETGDGYDIIQTRIKWDDEIVKTRLTQKLGAKSIDFSNKEINAVQRAIYRIQKHNTALLELDWYRNNNVYFRYDLSGSSQAIAKAKKDCGR